MDKGITRLAGRQMESWARELHSSDKWIKSSVHRELLEFLNRSETICTPGYLLRRRIQTAFPQFMARASERSGVPLSDCCDLEGCGNRPWPEALTRGLASVLAESFFPGFGAARTGIDSRQWYSYLTDSGAFGRETAIKLIFALGLGEPEGSKLLLAAGRELLSLRNPFDYICSYCLGHRPRLDYVKALELMRRYESGRSGRYDGPGRGLRQPFGYGMTASLSGRLESLLGGGVDEAGREDELIAYMLAHEEEFTARHGRGGYAPGFSMRRIRMLKELLKYIALLYPASVGLDRDGRAVNIPVATDEDGVPRVYSSLTAAMLGQQDIELLDYMELGIPRRGREKLSYDQIPFNEAIVLPLKNLSASLRAMTRPAEAPANGRDINRSTVLLLAYFYMSGCLYVPPRGLPLPSEGLEERLELDIREAEARGDAGAARMLYTLQEVADALYDPEGDPAKTCIGCLNAFLHCFGFSGFYPPFVLDRFIFLCLQADPMSLPMSADSALLYMMQLVISENYRLCAGKAGCGDV